MPAFSLPRWDVSLRARWKEVISLPSWGGNLPRCAIARALPGRAACGGGGGGPATRWRLNVLGGGRVRLAWDLPLSLCCQARCIVHRFLIRQWSALCVGWLIEYTSKSGFHLWRLVRVHVSWQNSQMHIVAWSKNSLTSSLSRHFILANQCWVTLNPGNSFSQLMHCPPCRHWNADGKMEDSRHEKCHYRWYYYYHYYYFC